MQWMDGSVGPEGTPIRSLDFFASLTFSVGKAVSMAISELSSTAESCLCCFLVPPFVMALQVEWRVVETQE